MCICDKIDSKSKWVKNTLWLQNPKTLVCVIHYFRILIWDAWSQFNDSVYKDKVSLSHLLKVLEQFKHSSSLKSTAINKVTSKFWRYCLLLQLLSQEWKQKVRHQYLTSAIIIWPTFQFFSCKIEIIKKIKWFCASFCDSNIIFGLLMIWEKQQDLFSLDSYNCKVNRCQKIKFHFWRSIFAHFSSFNFLVIKP